VIKILLLLLLIILDLFTKQLIINYIQLHEFIVINFFIDLTHIHNFGVSFGLFSGYISFWILALIGLLIVFFIYYLMLTSNDKFEKIGLFIIIGGALSNILDRLIHGYVIDFISLHYNKFYWPAFNLADIYITIGILMIIFNIFKKFYKK
tara:strand:+ start:425 stop:874 length:450 start_codon:yes stop_codon:yes gene_type:complete